MPTKRSFLSLVITTIVLLSLVLPANVLADPGDTIRWCPGSTPPAGGIAAGCTPNQTSFTTLIAYLDSTPTSGVGAGTIYVVSTYSAASETGSIYFNPSALSQMTNLTIQGGWNFASDTQTGISTIGDHGVAGHGHGLIIGNSGGTAWPGNVTLKNITVDQSPARGIDINATGNVELYTVTVTNANHDTAAQGSGIRVTAGNSTTPRNITFNNVDISGTSTSNSPVDYAHGATLVAWGAITITNGSSFINNSGDGLRISFPASLVVNNVSATGNGAAGTGGVGDGLSVGNIAQTAPVTITNNSNFDNNDGQGIKIAQGNITISNNVTASSNDEEGLFTDANSLNITQATFSGNGEEGLYAIDVVTSVEIDQSAFSTNALGGIFIINSPSIDLTQITALGNDIYGVGIYSDEGTITTLNISNSACPACEISHNSDGTIPGNWGDDPTAPETAGLSITLSNAADSITVSGLTLDDNKIIGANIELNTEDLIIRDSVFNNNGLLAAPNTLSAAGAGLFVENSYGGTLTSITADFNTGTGIFLNSSSQSINTTPLPNVGGGFVISCSTANNNNYFGVVADLQDAVDVLPTDGHLELRQVSLSGNTDAPLPDPPVNPQYKIEGGTSLAETTDCGTIISGNAGIAGATLSYFDVTPKTVTSEVDGDYSFLVPIDWSGDVTPSKTGCTGIGCVFAPLSLTYTNVLADQLNQNYTRPNWLNWVGGGVIETDTNVIPVSRPEIGSQFMTYNGFNSGGASMYVPMLFKDAFGGSYDSALYVQNISNSATATISIKFYDSNGVLTCTIPDSITALSSKGYWLPGLSCLGSSWVGGVVVTSNQNIVAVGRPHIGTEITTYDGFSAGSTTMYVPMMFKDAFGGSYDSALYVQNVSNSTTATISIKFYNSSGTLNCTIPDTIAPLASKGYWLPGLSCLGSSWVGGVVVTSDQNIVAVGRPHIDAQVTTYNGFAGGLTNAYVPMLFKDISDGAYDSALYVQNVDPSTTANVTLKFYDMAGTLSLTINDTIARLSSKGYWLPALALGTTWQGSVKVESDLGVVAVGRPHLGSEIMTYNGAPSGSLLSYTPMLFRNAFGGSYDSTLYLQNVDPTNSANVTIKFYDINGNLSCIQSDTIPSMGALSYFIPSVYCSP